MKGGRPDTRFQRARERLATEIGNGVFGGLGLLPGERDLAMRLSVSRATIRRVLAALVEEGRLVQRHGVGTFVTGTRQADAPRPASPAGDAALGGFAAAARRRGLVLTSDLLAQDVVQPPPDEAMLLACSLKDNVLRLRRLRRIDGHPVALEEALVPAPFWTDPATRDGSLHTALADAGTWPVRVLQRLRVTRASAVEAEGLTLDPGSPVIHLRRAEYVADGRCCVLVTSTLRADGFDLLVEFDTATAIPIGPFTAG